MKKPRFTEEQIVRILEEAASGMKSQTQLCKEHGISPNTFYVWKRKYSGLQIEDLRLLRELERDLEIDAIRALFRKNGWALPNPSRERNF